MSQYVYSIEHKCGTDLQQRRNLNLFMLMCGLLKPGIKLIPITVSACLETLECKMTTG